MFRKIIQNRILLSQVFFFLFLKIETLLTRTCLEDYLALAYIYIEIISHMRQRQEILYINIIYHHNIYNLVPEQIRFY